MLRNEWTDAWERPDTPDPLPMPLQYMVSGECVSRGSAYPDKALDVLFNPVGQIVGQMNQVRKARDVVLGLVEEYVEAVERLDSLNT
jgi:NAD(P)H-dependent flavin oxidoreductase YrpB (nitropropane dioxygenase family)